MPRLERSSNHGEPTSFTFASRCGRVGPLPPSRGVRDGAGSLRADHNETRGGVDPTSDTGFFLETSRHYLHWVDDDSEPRKLIANRSDKPNKAHSNSLHQIDDFFFTRDVGRRTIHNAKRHRQPYGSDRSSSPPGGKEKKRGDRSNP